MSLTTRDFLAEAVIDKAVIDRFLDSEAVNKWTFASELGYRGNTCPVKDGMDDGLTMYVFALTGERRTINYADRPCRINTYGNSFTQCSQANDCESWQDLAGHFREPVRNFSVGGYGVYQAYRRMLREEQTECAAEYVLFNIWGDDHYRSVYKWRWFQTLGFRRSLKELFAPGSMNQFHGNPWAHLELNTETGNSKNGKTNTQPRSLSTDSVTLSTCMNLSKITLPFKRCSPRTM